MHNKLKRNGNGNWSDVTDYEDLFPIAFCSNWIGSVSFSLCSCGNLMASKRLARAISIKKKWRELRIERC